MAAIRSDPKDNRDTETPSGFSQGLTNYGDEGFSLFLRKANLKGSGSTDNALNRPVIGVVNTAVPTTIAAATCRASSKRSPALKLQSMGFVR
jgi:hypothetical protein